MPKALLFFVLSILWAKGDEFLVPGSESPDKKYAVYAVDTPSLQPKLEIRLQSNGIPILTVSDGYDYNASTAIDPESTEVLWNTSGTVVAMKTRGTKTSTEVNLYKLVDGKFSNISLPNLFDSIKSKMGLNHGGRYGFESPKAWVSEKSLTINVSGSTVDGSGIGPSDKEWYSYDITVNASGKITEIKEIKKGYLPTKAGNK